MSIFALHPFFGSEVFGHYDEPRHGEGQKLGEGKTGSESAGSGFTVLANLAAMKPKRTFQSGSAFMTKLPLEIQLDIAEHLKHGDLYNLASTCSEAGVRFAPLAPRASAKAKAEIEAVVRSATTSDQLEAATEVLIAHPDVLANDSSDLLGEILEKMGEMWSFPEPSSATE